MINKDNEIDVEEYLSNFYKGKKNPSLKAMKFFMEKFHNFEKNMKFIHIAGTNGKGSCTEMISNILEKQGYRVGKFLSPHLIKYNERISINKKEISNKEMLDLIKELQPLIEEYNGKEGTNITLFELITIMALLYFYRNKVDFVVLETGLGGHFDCTNIISKPLVSIVTSIGYDHMKILGDTLPQIAYQKAGIIKNNSNTVIFEQSQEIDEVFFKECEKKENNLYIVKEKDISNYHFDGMFEYFDYNGMKNIHTNLKGKVQIKNVCICIEAVKILNEYGYKISDNSIIEGITTIIHKGRMEILNDTPKIIFDGAHNEPAVNNLLNMIDTYYSNSKRVYIISILKTKDYTKMLEILSKDENAYFVMTSGNNSDKYVTSDELYDCMKKYVNENRIKKENLDNAIENVMKENTKLVTFVIGSFYVYGDVTRKIKN